MFSREIEINIYLFIFFIERYILYSVSRVTKKKKKKIADLEEFRKKRLSNANFSSLRSFSRDSRAFFNVHVARDLSLLLALESSESCEILGQSAPRDFVVSIRNLLPSAFLSRSIA